MSLTHTAGDWSVGEYHFDVHRRKHYPIFAMEASGRCTHIADVTDHLDAGYDEATGEPISNPANAHLMAAAPDLLQALEAIYQECHAWFPTSAEFIPEVVAAKAAIAKATGKPETK